VGRTALAVLPNQKARAAAKLTPTALNCSAWSVFLNQAIEKIYGLVSFIVAECFILLEYEIWIY